MGVWGRGLFQSLDCQALARKPCLVWRRLMLETPSSGVAEEGVAVSRELGRARCFALLYATVTHCAAAVPDTNMEAGGDEDEQD